MKTDKYSIERGDCFDLIKEIKTKTIDLILTDPPYNLARHSTGNIKFEWREEVNNDIADWDKKEIEPNKIASNENDIVFDPFIRVASTGVAALKLNRKFVRIELEETYFKASENRLSKVK